MDMAMLAVEAKPIGIDETAKKLEVLSGAAGQAEVATKKLSSASGGATGAALAAARAYSQEGSAAAGASKQLEMMARAANQNGSAMGSSMLQMRMAAMQLSQVAQQAQTTGNFLGALAIQLPDLALGFGPVGIAAGIAAGAALTYFSNISDSGPATAQELKRQEDMIQRVAERWGEALPALQAYLAELNRTKEQSELLEVGKRLGEQEFAKAREQLVGLNDEFAALIVDLRNAGAETSTILDLQVAFEKVQKAVADGREDTDAMKDAQDALAASVKQTGIGALKDFTEQFTAFGEAVKTAAERAAAFQDQAMRAAILGSGSLNRLSPIFSEGGRFFSGEDLTPGDPAVPTRRPLIEMEGLPGTVKADRARRTKVAQVDTYASSVRSMQERIKAIQAETAAQQSLNPLIDDYDFAITKARASAELLAAAERAKKEITPELIAGIDQTATALAAATAEQNRHAEAVKKTLEAMAAAKEIGRSFFDDLLGGLERGEGLWKSFANAALNALKKIGDKLLDSAFDSIWDSSGIAKALTGKMSAANDNVPAAASAAGSAGAAGAVSKAMGLIGQSEKSPGQINSYLKQGGVDIDAARTAWCAGFVNSSLKQVGVDGTGSLTANSFLNWGSPVAGGMAQRGDVLVQSRGLGAGQQGGHVGFATGGVRMFGGSKQLEMLSGNSSNSVQTTWVEASQVQIRRMNEASTSLQGLTAANQNAAKGLTELGSGMGNFGNKLSTITGGGGSGLLSSLTSYGMSVFAQSGQFASAILGGGIGLFAKGGISDRPAIFGEAGPEAAVPLPDGRRIPVDLRGSKTGGGMTYAPVTNLDMRGSNWTEAQIEAKLDQRDQRIMQHLRESEAALPERVNYINKHPRKRPRP